MPRPKGSKNKKKRRANIPSDDAIRINYEDAHKKWKNKECGVCCMGCTEYDVCKFACYNDYAYCQKCEHADEELD